jgi:hypothetical protein
LGFYVVTVPRNFRLQSASTVLADLELDTPKPYPTRKQEGKRNLLAPKLKFALNGKHISTNLCQQRVRECFAICRLSIHHQLVCLLVNALPGNN